MKNENALAKLLKGSRNINKMREEIQAAISLLISLVGSMRIGIPLHLGHKHRMVKIQMSGAGWWTLEDNLPDQAGAIIIRYWDHDFVDGRNCQYQSTEFGQPCERVGIRSVHAQHMYQNLDALMDGILRQFPGIAKDYRWQLLMSAAEVEM